MTAEGPTGAPLRQQIAEALHAQMCETCHQRVYPCDEMDDDDGIYHMAADAVVALLNLTDERRETPNLGEWTPDCGGGDWCLSGPRWFANYWPDNTVMASIYAGEDEDDQHTGELANSGIMSGKSRADCQRKAEEWIRAQLPPATRYVTPWLPTTPPGTGSTR